MKKLTYFLILTVLFGCSSDSGDSSSSCGTASITNVSQEFETLTISWQSQGDFNYFEIGFDPTSSLNQGSSSLSFNNSFTTTNSSMLVEEVSGQQLNFYVQENETLSFYIRGQCTNGSLTNWEGPYVLQLDEFCEKPHDLSVFNAELSWDFNNYNVDASYYQVEYGLQGFVPGTNAGAQFTTNNQYLEGLAMVEGDTYDFYVRAFCQNNLGWSDWSSPISYYAEQDYNLCNPPSNLQYFIEYISGNSAGVRFEWDYNGESEFEYVLVSAGADVNSGTINTIDTFGWPVYTGLSVFSGYDFYVRGVCFDGSRTLWAGPLYVNP